MPGHTHTHTHTQTDYNNPLCACVRRVNDAVSSSISITTCVNSILDQLKCPKHWGAKDWGQSVASGKVHVSNKQEKRYIKKKNRQSISELLERKIGTTFGADWAHAYTVHCTCMYIC